MKSLSGGRHPIRCVAAGDWSIFCLAERKLALVSDGGEEISLMLNVPGKPIRTLERICRVDGTGRVNYVSEMSGDITANYLAGLGFARKLAARIGRNPKRVIDEGRKKSHFFAVIAEAGLHCCLIRDRAAPGSVRLALVAFGPVPFIVDEVTLKPVEMANGGFACAVDWGRKTVGRGWWGEEGGRTGRAGVDHLKRMVEEIGFSPSFVDLAASAAFSVKTLDQ